MSTKQTDADRFAARFKSIAKNKGMATDRAFARYAQEGILRRMQAEFGDDGIILKGGLLVLIQDGNEARPTMDADMHIHRRPADAEERIRRALLRDLEDHVRYEIGTVIKASHNEEPGLGIPLTAWIGPTRADTKLDIGFGGRRPAGIEDRPFPVLFEKETGPLSVDCLPWPYVMAEKVHAIQAHGIKNTRSKDFYDIWVRKDSMDPEEVARAIVHTWEDRNTALPTDLLPGLSIDYAESMQKIWAAFVKRSKLEGKAPDQFADVTYAIRPWVEDVLEHALVLSREAAPRVPAMT